MRAIAAVLLAGPLGMGAPPPPPAPPMPHLRAVRTPRPPVIDGKLDDPVWKLAVPSRAFRQKIPQDGAAPSETTTVRVLYDDTAIYVAFDCPQAHAPITQRLTRRDRYVEADSVSFGLGTRGDHKSSFDFGVNASGVLYDGIHYNDTDSSQDWDENWDAATHVTERGWTAEFLIPLRILRFPTRPVQSWDFQASRYISARQEQDDWAYYPRTMGGAVSHYGRLDDLEWLEERTPLELRPFVVGRLRRRDPTVGQLARGTDVWGSAGADFRWHPTADLTLDATTNPDFAQVEADQVVLNLSTVPTYYPEKRLFFLEGIEALSTPYQLLYTRRIGRAPPIPALRTDATNGEQLVDLPQPVTIYGAAKLTGRISEHWSVATMQAVTAPSDVQVQLADGTRVSRRLDPLTSFNAVRLKRDLGDNAHVALMVTAATHAEETERYPMLLPSAGYSSVAALCPIPVQLTPLQQKSLTVPANGRCTNDAYVGGVDWKWRSADGDWSINGQVVGSVLENGPVRPVADGTRIHSGDVGWAVYSQLRKEGGKHWVGGAYADVESRAFAIEDLGFNPRANQITTVWDLERRDLDPFGPFLEHRIKLHYSETYDFAGTRVSQPLYFYEIAKLKNFWVIDANLHYRSDRFDDREVGDGTALERRARVGAELEVDTDPTKPVVGFVHQNADVIPDALDTSGSGGASFKVLPQWDLDLLPTWQWSFGEPRFAANGGAPGQYLFGKLDGRSVGLTVRTTYTFTPRLTLQAYAQLFLASGHYSGISQFQSNPSGPRPLVYVSELTPYGGTLPQNPDFEQGVLNINVVLRWEYMLGSILYVVYTRAQVPTTVLGPTDVGTLDLGAVGRAPTSDAALVKVSFWWGP
jgi:hypothetical protein